jgi:hypothetical protein
MSSQGLRDTIDLESQHGGGIVASTTGFPALPPYYRTLACVSESPYSSTASVIRSDLQLRLAALFVRVR